MYIPVSKAEKSPGGVAFDLPNGNNTSAPTKSFGRYKPVVQGEVLPTPKKLSISPSPATVPFSEQLRKNMQAIGENDPLLGIKREFPNIKKGDLAGTGLTSSKDTPVRDFVVEVGQSMARNIGSAGLSLVAPTPQGIADSLKASDFKSFFGQALFETVFGKDAEIKPIETRIAEAEPKVQEWGTELEKLSELPNLNMREKFVTKTLSKLAKNNPRSLSFLGIMGSVGLDLTPFGGLEKNAYKAIVNTKTIGEGLQLGRKLGIADDLLEDFARNAVKAGKEEEAKLLFNSVAEMQLKTKPKVKIGENMGEYIPMAERNLDEAKTAIPEGAPAKTIETPTPAIKAPEIAKTAQETAPKIGDDIAEASSSAPAISKDLEPLAVEARKYKSAEEFVSAQTKEISAKAMAENPTVKKYNYERTSIPIKDIKEFETVDLKSPKFLEIKRSISRGDRTPIILDERNRIIDGHHRFNAYKESGVNYGSVPALKATGEGTGKIIKDTNYYDPKIKGSLTDFYNKAVGGESVSRVTKQLPIPKGLPEIRVKDLPVQKTTEGAQTKKVIRGEPPAKVTKTEPALLKERLKQQASGARAGYQSGKKVGKAEAENIATTKIEKAVRKEELKSLKGGIKLREAKDKIINKLKATGEATQEIKNDVVEFVKENLDQADRGKALVIVRDAKTQKDLTKAFARVNRWAEEAEKKTIRNEILKTQKEIMDSPSVAVDYKAKVKELMGDFELKGHREETLERLKKTQEFLGSEAKKGNDVEMPRRVLKSLELLNRTPFEQITASQLSGLKAEMDLLEELGKTKWKTIENIWDIQKKKILDEVKIQGAEPINNIKLIKPEIGERLTPTQKLKNFIFSAQNQAARIDKAISPMDTIFDLLDGGKGTYDGANFKFFKGQVDSGYGRYISRKDALQEPVIETARKFNLDDRNFERMGVVAAREQDKGMEKLVASGFTEDQVNAIKLTNEEQKVLDLMRETFDSQFPEIQETMRKVYNQPVEKVKNYFSFMTDWKAMDDAEVFQRFGSQGPEQYGAPRKNVEAGFTKSRVGGDQKIKVNALDVFLKHTDNTSYLLELGETSKMLGEVAASKEYADMVGDVGQLMVREWLDVIARKGGAAGASTIPVLDTLRKNVGAGILGLKLSTVAIQPTALIDGMGFIGAKYGTKGLNNFITNPEWRKFVAKMPEISDRMGGEFALRELTDDNWLQSAQRMGFIPMQKLDQMTAGAIASGAYERKMIELGKKIDFAKYDPEALAYAQLAVRRTQSSGAFKDVPLAVSRGALTGNRSLDRAALQFQNFLLTRWSRIRHDAVRAGINTKDPKKAIPIFTAIIMSAIAASGIRLGVNKIQDFITGKEDEDSVAEDLQKGFMYEMTGNVPFLGTAVSMAMYDGEMFPILDAPKGIVSGLNRVITSESEGAKLRGLTEFAGSMGALIGIPGSAQAEIIARGLLQEEKKPEKKKKSETPVGLPKLPSIKKTLPSPPGLPKLPTL